MINKTILGGEEPPFYFKGSNVKLTYLTSDYILSKISEYDIFKRYCTNFVEVNRAFCSDLREDNKPDVFIYNDSNGKLHYNDIAIRQRLNCFSYVMVKYGIDYKTALKVIYEDLKVYSVRFKAPEKKLTKLKTILEIEPRSFNYKDYQFWSKYGIDLTTLVKFNVCACKSVYYIKGEKQYTFREAYNDPIYAYKFVEDGQIYYKIYRPYNDKFKFMFNGNVNCIEGYDQLPLFGDLLIIGKALKDDMVYSEMDIPAISLQGEKNPLSESLMKKLRSRFKLIILNFDPDETGVEATEEISKQYNLPYFYIDKCKDISDYVKKYGLEEGKKLINEKIKNIV